jgi:hypothetical protein
MAVVSADFPQSQQPRGLPSGPTRPQRKMLKAMRHKEANKDGGCIHPFEQPFHSRFYDFFLEPYLILDIKDDFCW